MYVCSISNGQAQKVLLAAQEREQRIQESNARTAAENNKLFAASVDKNRKTAVLFLPQAPSSSAVQVCAVGCFQHAHTIYYCGVGYEYPLISTGRCSI